MADSIHDQWDTSTSEWPTMAANFLQAWITAYDAIDVNDNFAAIVACIGFLSRMVQDSTVMSGNMLTQVANTGGINTRGLVQNFQNLERHVFPQWGAVAAAYATSTATALVAAEAQQRVVADDNEASQRALGDDHSREQAAAAVLLESQLRAFADAAADAKWTTLLNAEAVARAAGDDHSRQQAAAALAAAVNQLSGQIDTVLKYAQSLPGLIDQRAANGYDPTIANRASLLQKLIDTAAAHDPVVAGLVSKLAVYIVDLASVEDPLIRVAAQLLVKQIIDRFGLDTALHAMLGDLLSSVFGGGPPKTLQDVMADVGNRLAGLEESVAALSPLDDEADQLHEMGGIAFNLALVGFAAGAVADPVATANGTVLALEPVTGPLLAPLRALLGM